MRKITPLNQTFKIITFFALTFQIGFAQTHSGNLDITSQAQLDALPTYTDISGRLRIKGADITDLSNLSTITAITANLEILDSNDMLTSLNGLEGLTSIGGNFWLRNNPELVDISALSNLTEILNNTTGGLYVIGNAKLTALGGLNNLATVTNMYIGDRDGDPNDGEANPLLTDLCALETAANYSGLVSFIIAHNGFNPSASDIASGTNCSSSLGVDDILAKAIRIYPNPSNGIIKLFDFNNEEYQVSIINNLGQIVVKNKILSDQKGIDISNLKKGIYFLNIRLRDRQTTKKLIKSN